MTYEVVSVLTTLKAATNTRSKTRRTRPTRGGEGRETRGRRFQTSCPSIADCTGHKATAFRSLAARLPAHAAPTTRRLHTRLFGRCGTMRYFTYNCTTSTYVLQYELRSTKYLIRYLYLVLLYKGGGQVMSQGFSAAEARRRA